MADETEMIKHQMEETRSSLAEKLETLEHQVMETVQGATSAVTDTVENVKDAVQETVDTVKGSVTETVETVKHTFDLKLQVDRRPWTMFAGSVAMGYLGGCLMPRASRMLGGRSFMDLGPTYQRPEPFQGEAARGYEAVTDTSRSNGFRSEPAASTGMSWLAGLGGMFESELGKLKKLAIGTAMAAVRDLIQPSIPEPMKPQLEELINNFTTKLGGEVIEGPILSPSQPGTSEAAFGSEHTAASQTGRPSGACL
jgi:ElaB/YqjD/DUF883 family membrane-anchored ribosome-binding protein